MDFTPPHCLGVPVRAGSRGVGQQAAWGPRAKGHTRQWSQVPHRQSRGRLHPRMPRDPRRFFAARAPRHPDARRRRPRARLSRYPRRRQSTVSRRSIRSAQPARTAGREGARSSPAAIWRTGHISTASGCSSSIHQRPGGLRSDLCAEHVRQLGGGSPLPSLMAVKGQRSTRASSRGGVCRPCGANPRAGGREPDRRLCRADERADDREVHGHQRPAGL